MTTTRLPEFWVSKARLETLLDGVFAIAMTLMVLELKIPELQNRRSMPELMVQLRHNWAPIFGFLLSVAVLGMFWYKHHRQYHLIHRVDRGLLGINLGFLTAVAFFPFAAVVIGRFPGNPGVFFIYLPSISFLTICLAAQWGYARRKGLLDPDLPADAATLLHRRNVAAALGISIVSALFIFTTVWTNRSGSGNGWVVLIPMLMLPFGIGLRRWARRQGI